MTQDITHLVDYPKMVPAPEVTPLISENRAEALPWVFKVVFNKDELQPLLDHWWEGNKLSTIPALVRANSAPPKNGKKSKPNGHDSRVYTKAEATKVLGPWGVYNPLLKQLTENSVREKIWPRDMIFSTDFGLVEDEKHLTLTCRYWEYPTATFTKDLQDFEIQLPKPTETEIKIRVTDQFEAYRHQKSREYEKTNAFSDDTSVADGDMVVITVNPTIDDKPWKAGQIKNNKMRVLKGSLHPDTFYNKLIGLKVGNHLLQFDLNEKYGPDAGKTVKAEVTIHSILTYALPDVDDELAKQLSFKSLEEMQTKTHSQVEDFLVQQWEGKAAEEIITALIERAEFGPVPESWIRVKAENILEHQLRAVKGELNKLLEAWKVQSKFEILQRLGVLAKNEAYQVVAIMSYGDMLGITRDKDTELGNISTYLQKVLKHLIETTKVRNGPVS
jgi:hypothetical protein